MRNDFQILATVLVFLLSASCNSIEVGFEPTPTITDQVPTQHTKTPQPVLTATPTTSNPTKTEEGIKSYTQPDYGFSFQYPATWKIQTGRNQILLIKDSTELLIGFKNSR